ncbi:bifunctional ADP-dependent NAD(P)H-hydrate dehydratase/NAD(P)H-hydrate epimerase [Actinomyces sp. W5033]|uniref:bifunctional ADP-dependent NAD(P)H-hydrate dehydratase/NAD(P)H-hydrate epimerase n=1 Tax=Actinomyces sp. W5033 TaxID=3446479 RepID=UPI003EE3DDAF
MMSLDTTYAYPAAAIAAAEAPLTRATEAYMHAAAQALAQAAVEELRAGRGRVVGAPVLVLAGGGHNGGDALLAAALLAHQGCEVTALLATDHPHGAALAEARRAGVRVGPQDAADPELVVDGLTGLGASGPLRPRAAGLVAPLIAAGAPGKRPVRVLAVDVPSGVGVDDGSVEGPVLAADRTVTFTCLRGAHVRAPAAALCGRVDVIDLGLPVPEAEPLAPCPADGARVPAGPGGPGGPAGPGCPAGPGRPGGPGGPAPAGASSPGLHDDVLCPADAVLARRLRVPGERDHKYTRGVVELWAGSETYPGAAVLTSSGAWRAGAGMVRLAAPRRVEDLVLAHRPETVPVPGRHQAIVIGPGTDPEDEPRATQLRRALGSVMRRAGGSADTPPVPAVIDAGALPLLPDLLAQARTLTPSAVITPHAGEAAALLSALGRPTARPEAEDPATAPRIARELVHRTGACVLLKGTPTLVATADGACFHLDSGPGWLATAGSGDVLAGVLGCLLAADQARAEASAAGAGRHPAGRTAARTGQGLLTGADTAACAALAVRVHALAGALASGGGAVGRTSGAGGQASAPPGTGAHRSGHPVTALDVAEAVPAAVEHLLSLVEESSP